MEDISENETCITISSDNGSPAKTVVEHKSEENNTSSIVLTDTELEEGEISEEEEEKESKETKNNAAKAVVDKSGNKCVSTTNSNTSKSKRKLNEGNFEMNKKGKYSETNSNVVKKNLVTGVEEFPWSELRVLLVGDERVKNLDWKDWKDMPVLETSLSKHCNLETLCSLVEKNLHKEYDVVVVFSFHHDFVNINETFFDNGSDKIFMDLKSDVNIVKLLNTVQKYHLKWERQFPNTYVIWTLPYPPDFLKFNSVALKGKNCSPEKVLNEQSQNELTRNYYALAKKFLRDWKANNKQIPIFPLTKVLFIKKHCYKKSFEGSGSPKFPRGYLIDGLYPSKLMVLYIAYLLIEFLVDYEFYPENKYGLDLKELETRFEEIDPLYATYFHNDKNNSTTHKKSKRHKHHSRKRKRYNSLSPLHKHSKSRSRSRRRRSRSSSRHRRRRSSSKRRRKSHSRSRSGSLSNQREAHSNSSITRRSISKAKYSQSDKNLSSLSPSSITSDSSSVKTESHNSICSKEDKDSKDEVSFFKTLRYLREVHEIQCRLYRRKPHTHPLYNIEKGKFLKKQNSKLPLELHLPKWEQHWKEKMEKIFKETWTAKKDQLTIDLSKKVSFTSLHNNVADTSSSSVNLNDGQEGNEKNRETISSFLNKFDLDLQWKNKSSENVVDLKKYSGDFTLADIFKGTHSQDLESPTTKCLRPTDSTNISTKDSITSNSSYLKTQQVPDNPQVDSDSESGSGSIKFDDSDLDVDEILENPDFLQGLEEIDRELQNAIPAEKNKTETTNSQSAIFVPTSSSTTQSDLSFLFRGNEKKKECKENLKEEFVNVLKMLFRVSKRLGPLGLSVSALYTRVTEELENNKETFQSINSDSNALLRLVEKKLNSFLKEDLPQVQKAIYGEIAERLQSLLQKVNSEEQNLFPKVNIVSIAAATLGLELTDVIAFIKNTLLYHGYTKHTNDDVMNIYMSVKASQLDMEKK